MKPPKPAPAATPGAESAETRKGNTAGTNAPQRTADELRKKCGRNAELRKASLSSLLAPAASPTLDSMAVQASAPLAAPVPVRPVGPKTPRKRSPASTTPSRDSALPLVTGSAARRDAIPRTVGHLSELLRAHSAVRRETLADLLARFACAPHNAELAELLAELLQPPAAVKAATVYEFLPRSRGPLRPLPLGGFSASIRNAEGPET